MYLIGHSGHLKHKSACNILQIVTIIMLHARIMSNEIGITCSCSMHRTMY